MLGACGGRFVARAVPGPAVQVPYRVAPLEANARQELSDGFFLGVVVLHDEQAAGGKKLEGAGGNPVTRTLPGVSPQSIKRETI